MIMKNIFSLLCLITLISCNEEKDRQVLNFDFPKKEMEIDKLVAYNTDLEQQNHEKFIIQFEKDKEEYFDDKVDKFLESYDSFDFINIQNRKWFKSETAIQSEIDTHLKLVFNPIDYQKFEEKKVNEYLDLLKENRKQFEIFQGNETNRQWQTNVTEFNFYDRFSENVLKNLEGAFYEQVLLFALEIIDWLPFILFLLGVGSIKINPKMGIILLIISLILPFYFEGRRKNRIKGNIMNTIKAEIISTENETLLKQLNTNTKNYYYGKN